MKLKIVTKSIANSTAKCTIHLSGKLGFSQEAVNKLSLSEKSYIRLAVNDEDKEDQNLYMLISRVQSNDSIKVRKAGSYYFCATKQLFDEMAYDYITKKIIFDIAEVDYEGEKVYKLRKREISRKKKK
jgi:hypothetical protein